MTDRSAVPKQKGGKPRTFVGWVLFAQGEPWLDLGTQLSRRRWYLMRSGLSKMNALHTAVWHDRVNVERAWKRHAKALKLSLRRAYVG